MDIKICGFTWNCKKLWRECKFKSPDIVGDMRTVRSSGINRATPIFNYNHYLRSWEASDLVGHDYKTDGFSTPDRFPSADSL